jgi:hypothetical protein
MLSTIAVKLKRASHAMKRGSIRCGEYDARSSSWGGGGGRGIGFGRRWRRSMDDELGLVA